METRFQVGDRVRLTRKFLESIWLEVDDKRLAFFTGTVVWVGSDGVSVDFDGRSVIQYRPKYIEFAENGLEVMFRIAFEEST